MIHLIIISSILFQLAAAVLALRLIPETGRKASWILLSLGLVGMVLRRAQVFVLIFQEGHTPNLLFELTGLAISIAIFAGIASIRPLFRKLKNANKELAQSELRFKTMADFTHDWEYWRGPDGAFIYMSPSCERITGYGREAFMEDPGLMRRIIHPDDQETVIAHLAAESGKKMLGELDFRIISAEGEVHWISHCCTPVFGTANEYLGVRASNRNITQRKIAEAGLEQSRRQYHDLVEQAQSIILEMNTAGEVVFLNGFGQDFFNFSPEEIYGVQSVGTLLPEDCTAVVSILEKGAVPVFDECEATRKDGGKAWISWARSAILDENGQPKGILCVGLDNTARKAADKLKEDVERIVRHDLKSPLMGIIGLPRLLLQDGNLNEEQREMLTAIKMSGRQMLELINQSLNLYKLESGVYEYDPQIVDLLEIILRAKRDLCNQFSRQPGIVVTINNDHVTDADHLPLPGDETLLYCMVSNLLKNALEAAGSEPVVVALQPDDPCVMEISNSLPVPAPLRDNFFEKYTTYGKNDGTGLGTYSALLAVKAHGGAISMECSENGGTKVRVELPCWKE